MLHTITQIDKKGLAFRHGLRIGDGISMINNVELIDQIDYQYMTSYIHLSLQVNKADGRKVTVEIINTHHAPLGLQLDETLKSRPRRCKNKCKFCFVDQMPKECAIPCM